MASRLTERRRETTRAEILAVAEELFVRNGVRATSMAQVGESVGLGRAALYYYFPSKDALVKAAVDTIAERFRMLDDISSGTTLPATMRNLTTHLIQTLAGPDGGLRVLLAALIEQLDEDTEQQVVRRVIDRFRRDLAELVRRAQRSGEAADVDADEVTGRLTSKILGIEIMHLLDPEFDFRTAAEHAEREFLAAVEPMNTASGG